MKYEAFKRKLLEKLPEYLPVPYSGWETSVSEVPKVNGYREAIHITPTDEPSATPNLYVDELFAFYQKSGSLERTCVEAATAFIMGMGYLQKLDMQLFEGTPKERVIFTVIPQAGNERLLAAHPHRLFLDLAIIYRVLLDAEDGGFDSAIVTFDILEELDVTEEDLFQLAMENTPELLKVSFRELEEGLFVLTNERCLMGASVMLYPHVMEAMANALGSDLFIFPASIHEIFVTPDVGQDVGALNHVVESANIRFDMKDTFLADHVYYYMKDTDTLSIPLVKENVS